MSVSKFIASRASDGALRYTESILDIKNQDRPRLEYPWYRLCSRVGEVDSHLRLMSLRSSLLRLRSSLSSHPLSLLASSMERYYHARNSRLGNVRESVMYPPRILHGSIPELIKNR
ncbi:unnamed protein product, partial [Trichogramma brassicae]